MYPKNFPNDLFEDVLIGWSPPLLDSSPYLIWREGRWHDGGRLFIATYAYNLNVGIAYLAEEFRIQRWIRYNQLKDGLDPHGDVIKDTVPMPIWWRLIDRK